LATLVVVLAGCATSRPDQPAAAPGGPPRPGGTLKVAVSSDQGCLDPQQVTSNDTVYSARQLVDSLTDQDPASGRFADPRESYTATLLNSMAGRTLPTAPRG
jgi:peptide/nickel transport system substrate-binding protein